MSDDIKWLARHAARQGLRLNQATSLFEALYLADALAQTGGNVTQAANKLEVNREWAAKKIRGRPAPTDKEK